MSSNHHNDQVFREKKTIKGEIKFNITLTEEQKEAKRLILDNKVTVLKGQAGSGKTVLAAAVGLDQLFKKQVERIIIARPAVTSGEEIGFLPGTMADKLSPFTAPVYDNMYRVYNKTKIDELIKDGTIMVIPFAFMRGYNFSNSFVIIDEAQNATLTQLKLVLSRFCEGSKYVVCGDTKQIDLRNKKDSGFDVLYRELTKIEGFTQYTLKENHRDPIVDEIIKAIEEYEN